DSASAPQSGLVTDSTEASPEVNSLHHGPSPISTPPPVTSSTTDTDVYAAKILGTSNAGLVQTSLARRNTAASTTTTSSVRSSISGLSPVSSPTNSTTADITLSHAHGYSVDDMIMEEIVSPSCILHCEN